MMPLMPQSRILLIACLSGIVICTYYLFTKDNNFYNWLPNISRAQNLSSKVFTLNSGWDERAFFLYHQRYNVLKVHKESRVITFPVGGITARIVPSKEWNQFWDLVAHGGWEINTYNTFMQFITSDTTVIDVGTWIGTTIIFNAQLARRTYAIEADPVAFAEASLNLIQNVQASWYSRIHFQPGCIGVKETHLEMKTAEPGNSMSSLHRFYQETNQSVATKWSVRCYTLPYILNAWQIDPAIEHVFIKIDIESYECKLLPSLYSWLAGMKRKPTFYIAMHKQIVSCEKAEYAAIVKIANLFRFRSSAFVDRNNTVSGTGEYILSDLMAPG